MITARNIASYFIQRSSELNESNDLTNLKLQKILFYAQAENLKNTGNVLFNDQIEAWEYGPVVSDVYHWLKGCGAYPISTFDVAIDTSNLSEELVAELAKMWEKYSKYSAGFLVEKTHEQGSPWHTAFSSRNKTIPIENIALAKLANDW